MFTKIKKFISKYHYKVALVTLVAILLTFLLPVHIQFELDSDKQPVIIVGMQNDVLAAGVADYTCDGVADDVQAQAAMDALPTTGGKLVFLTGNYVFANTVTRAIDNIEIQGNGYATYFANNGATALFSAGTQDRWIFRDFRTDAGGINEGGADYWVMENIWEGANYWQLSVDSSITSSNYNVPFVVDISGIPVNDDFAKFTDVNTIEGRSYSETRSDLDVADITGTPTDNEVVIWTDADTIEGSNLAGTFTIMVAAFDATDAEKVAALASGGTVCDTNDDWDNIDDAIALANGGIVQLSSGTFYLDQGVVEEVDDVTIQGVGSSYYGTLTGTILDLNSSSDGVRILDKGKMRQLTFDSPNGFTGVCCNVYPEEGVYPSGGAIDRENLVLEDITFKGSETDLTGHTGTALRLTTNSTATHQSTIELCSFSDISISGYENGLHFYGENPDNGPRSWLNGNNFSNFAIAECVYSVYFQMMDDNKCNGNTFINFQINAFADATQPAGLESIDGIKFYYENLEADYEGCQYNVFENVWIWDWALGSGSPINFGAISDCRYNTVRGFLGGEYPIGNTEWNNWMDYTCPTLGIRRRSSKVNDIYTPSGIYCTGELGADGITLGSLIYLNTTRWEDADADAEATAGDCLLGIALEGGDTNDTIHILLYGSLWEGGDPPNWDAIPISPGVELYASTTAGEITHTAPSGAGDIVRVIGYGWEDDDRIFFTPESGWYECDAAGKICKINGIAIDDGD